jgi:hypothetical protein
VLLSATPTWAQFTLRSGLTGVVTDPSNAVVSGITVTLTDLVPQPEVHHHDE